MCIFLKTFIPFQLGNFIENYTLGLKIRFTVIIEKRDQTAQVDLAKAYTDRKLVFLERRLIIFCFY